MSDSMPDDFLEPPPIARELSQAIVAKVAGDSGWRPMRDGELKPGPYSAFVLFEDGTWEQPTYRVPEGWTENEVARALQAENRRVVYVAGISPDPDAPQDCVRAMPHVEIEPDDEESAPGVVPNPPVELMQVAVVSTKHLSQDEALRNRKDWPTHTFESEWGFIAHTALATWPVDESSRWPGLFAAAQWADAHGYDWVRFDPDAEEQPGLPTFDW